MMDSETFDKLKPGDRVVWISDTLYTEKRGKHGAIASIDKNLFTCKVSIDNDRTFVATQADIDLE